MLDRIFMQIFQMSFMASIVIAIVLIARVFLKKAPKIFSYALWSVVLIRLICPFSIKSVLSLIPKKANNISQQIVTSNAPHKVVSAPPIINTPQPNITTIPQNTVVTDTGIDWLFVIEIIWIIGILAMLLYSVVSLVKLQKSLKYSLNYRDNIYLAQGLKSPFVMGVFRPKIYLPDNITDDEKEYIILHEQMHIKRFDYIIKIISFLILCLHWFNPLVWVAFFMSSKDMEMSCDESVIKKLGNDVKKDYSTSLLSLATGKRIIGGIPLAFGEGNTKGRIKNILNYKKPAFWVIIVCVLAVIAICVGLMTNPKEKKTDETVSNIYEYRTQYVGDNSKVGGIIFNLEYPENIQYKDFELSTDQPPYAVTVNFTTDTKTRNYSGAINQQPFEIIAVKMFSLIHNVDYINFSLDDGINLPYSMQYTRDWATDNMETDLWLASESEESFLKLCEDIESKLNEKTNGQEFTESFDSKKLDNGIKPAELEDQVILTKETANEFIRQTLSTFKLNSDNTVSFTLPKALPTDESEKTKLYISSSATFSPEPGTSSVQEILDMTSNWHGGESYIEKLDVSKGKLTRIFLRIAFMMTEGENSYREYAADYIEFTEPFKFDTPVNVTDRSVEISDMGTDSVLIYTMQDGDSFKVTLSLPKEVTLSKSENYPEYNSNSDSEMPTVVVVKNTIPIGTLTLFGFGTYNKEDLIQIDTAKNTLPMQIFAPVALSNHAQYENYKVCKSSATGANATAKYLWQDLTNYGGNTPDAPWLKSDSILAYDYEKAPFFINLNLIDNSLNITELENLSKSISITKTE